MMYRLQHETSLGKLWNFSSEFLSSIAIAGIKYEIEDQVQGRFAFMAYTHPALWEFRHGENGREEMYNRGEGKAYVFIHMWPGDNRVDKNIIRPFVREFDRELHGENILENLGQ